MRVAILRREPGFSFSMDVYAEALVAGLKTVRPDWEIVQFRPESFRKESNSFLNGLRHYYERYWHYPRTMKNQPVDLFHIIDHSDGHIAYWLKQLDQPTVITCHDLINLVRPETFKNRARLPLVSLTAWKWSVRGMEKADKVLTVSNHTAKDVLTNLAVNSSRITVTPNAVDPRFTVLTQSEISDFRSGKGIGKDTFCLLNVGSNNVRKNILSILKAVALLKERSIPVHFWKAGTGFNQEQNNYISDYGLQSLVTYVGEPDEKTLIQLYNAADVLVAPSLYEGFGMTILESMACGTPVVTSNVTSLPEVAGDAAILVAPDDIEALTNAICYLYEDPDQLQTLRKKGLVRAKQFTWEKTAENVARAYESVI